MVIIFITHSHYPFCSPFFSIHCEEAIQLDVSEYFLRILAPFLACQLLLLIRWRYAMVSKLKVIPPLPQVTEDKTSSGMQVIPWSMPQFFPTPHAVKPR